MCGKGAARLGSARRRRPVVHAQADHAHRAGHQFRRGHQAPAHGQLVQPRLRQGVPARGRHDAGIRPATGKAQHAVAQQQMQVGQQGVDAGYQETMLFNEQDELTEGSSCNAFIVKDGVISTPPLDQQILPGITRLLLLQILRKHSTLPVQERVISKAEVLAADEVWLTSSSKELMPVIAIDGQPVGSGEVGAIWYQAQQLFAAHKFADEHTAVS